MQRNYPLPARMHRARLDPNILEPASGHHREPGRLSSVTRHEWGTLIVSVRAFGDSNLAPGTEVLQALR